MLIGLTPLFHSCLLAYLELRSMFLGMAIAGTESPVVLSARFGEALRVLIFGAAISGIVLLSAIVIAARGRRERFAATPPLAGRRIAIVLTTSSVLLLLGLFIIPLVAMKSAGEMRTKLFYASIAGVWLAGAVVFLAAICSVWVVRKVSRAESSSAASPIRALTVALSIVVLTGAVSWLAQESFIRIATTGGSPPLHLAGRAADA